jgi:hypothetical protein
VADRAELSKWANDQLKLAFNALIRELTYAEVDRRAVQRHAGRVMALVDECHLAGELPARAMAAAHVYADPRPASAWLDEYRTTVHEVRWRKGRAASA